MLTQRWTELGGPGVSPTSRTQVVKSTVADGTSASASSETRMYREWPRTSLSPAAPGIRGGRLKTCWGSGGATFGAASATKGETDTVLASVNARPGMLPGAGSYEI